jgi:hypothetical protein
MSVSNSRSRWARVYMSAAMQEFATCPVRQAIIEYDKFTTKTSKRSISKPIRLELHVYRVFIVYSDTPPQSKLLILRLFLNNSICLTVKGFVNPSAT